MVNNKDYVDKEYLKLAADELNCIKQLSYDYLNVSPGNRLLDVGCGPGTDTIPMARLVGETGLVVGIDHDEIMLQEAKKKAIESAVSNRVWHLKANIEHIPCEDRYFDACRSERVFQHLTNPEQVLHEMIRVTKLLGLVVVLDTDWATFSIDTDETDIERRLSRFTAEHLLCNGYSGRRLFRLFTNQNLIDIFLGIFPTYVTNYTFARQAFRLDQIEKDALRENVITQHELDRWHSSLEKADEEKYFYASLNLVLMGGYKSS
jgi:ubiquinone/menaquinone biosynthesis C-methylase UbiE